MSKYVTICLAVCLALVAGTVGPATTVQSPAHVTEDTLSYRRVGPSEEHRATGDGPAPARADRHDDPKADDTRRDVESDAAGATQFADDDHAEVSVEIRRRNDTTVAYRLSFDLPPSVDAYRVLLYSGRVVTSSEFRSLGSDRTLKWTGDGDPSVTVVYDVRAAARNGCQCVAVDEWVVAQPLRVQFTKRANGRTTTSYLSNWMSDRTVDSSIAVDGGRLLPGVLFLGPTRQVNATTAAGRESRVVGPADRDSAPNVSRVSESIQFGSSRFDAGSTPDDPLTFVVVPGDDSANGSVPAARLQSRGVATGRGYVFVAEGTGPSTWIHEYVHTRQDYTTERSMEWFTEATAEYYGRYLGAAFESGGAPDPADVYEGPSSVSGRLDRPSTWGSQYVPYERGGRLVAYLDYRIRRATDGQRDFGDVFRRLNGRQHLTLADLETAIAAVVGSHALDGVVERYATTDVEPPATWGEASHDDPATRQQELFRRAGTVQSHAREDPAGGQGKPGAMTVLVLCIGVLSGIRVNRG